MKVFLRADPSSCRPKQYPLLSRKHTNNALRMVGRLKNVSPPPNQDSRTFPPHQILQQRGITLLFGIAKSFPHTSHTSIWHDTDWVYTHSTHEPFGMPIGSANGTPLNPNGALRRRRFNKCPISLQIFFNWGMFSPEPLAGLHRLDKCRPPQGGIFVSLYPVLYTLPCSQPLGVEGRNITVVLLKFNLQKKVLHHRSKIVKKIHCTDF